MDSLRENVKATLEYIRADKQTHAGLWLEKYIANQDKENSEQRKEHIASVAALAESAAYVQFYQQWEDQLNSYGAKTQVAQTQSRLTVGLGSKSVLETSIALHRTYGVPYIPGSALKGLATRYVYRYLGPDWQEKSAAHTVLFGTNDESGYITFFDALYIPGTGHHKQALHPDIITVHHPAYYQKGNAAPADWDSPNPIPLLSATGHYLIALAAPDLQQADVWLNLAFTILTGALQHMGVGAKTSSGYGRMLLASATENKPVTEWAKNTANRKIQNEVEQMPKVKVNQAIHDSYKSWALIKEPEDKYVIATTIIAKIKAEGYEQSKSKKDWYQEIVTFVENYQK